ncbi:hypothetical protein ROSEINA2194_03053 [Roseburia inulinivorans DSM 16841]|uniref:Uncharacterized protein n=1 Tax=Roseburia inulinivorans DSM 16841 TaxID=622312 RepID=C0FWC6_9FIRM|nr:hypothetical protein ROSEINA2194_03053 [Roseburia inulinivorans DSM 16841]
MILMKLFNRKLEETYMFDFIINLFAEIADFFLLLGRQCY